MVTAKSAASFMLIASDGEAMDLFIGQFLERL